MAGPQANDSTECGRTDRLPPAGGAAHCPSCETPVRAGRPPLDLEGLRLARFCVLLFRPIVCLWLWLRQRRKEALVNAMLDQIAQCRDREEYRQYLGDPLYAVSGPSCGAVLGDGSQEAPDLIECYEWAGCCIDLWFKGDRLVSTSGFVKPTVWDVALVGGAEAARV
jgi:hypothetical protein